MLDRGWQNALGDIRGCGMESRVEPPLARRVQANLADLAEAFDDASWELSVYLDLDTGEVISLTAEIREGLERIYAELPEPPGDEDVYKAAFVAALERHAPPGRMHELLQEADAVESGLGIRFIRLPESDSREGHADMQAFIETDASPRLQDRLWAIAFGAPFAASRTRSPATRPSESAGSPSKMIGVRLRVLEWLADKGIELIEKTS
jgi:hypothetical protein